MLQSFPTEIHFLSYGTYYRRLLHIATYFLRSFRCPICSFRFFPASYSGFSFFRPPPGFRGLYALFSPIITHAVPAAVHPGHERKSSSCRYNHQLESAHILYLILPTPPLSAPRYPRRTQDDVAHRLPVGSHASEDFPQQKFTTQCVR